MYSHGRGISKDDLKAKEWYKKCLNQYKSAAEQGEAEAQYELGMMYSTGYGGIITRDQREADKWILKAADQGYKLAQNAFIRRFEIQAEHHGDVEAQFGLGYMYAHGRIVSQNDNEALKWYQKAADQGHAEAQEHLGNMYAHGRGVSKDDRKAEEWFQKAASQRKRATEEQERQRKEEARGREAEASTTVVN